MAKTLNTSKPGSNPTARAAQRPSKGTSTKPAVPGTATYGTAPLAQASPLPTVATPTPQPAAAPATVALRGGAAVAQVVLTGKPYRTAAPHNQQWWRTITTAAAAGPAAVAALAVSPSNPQGVPLHFVGYCLRRGYLAAAPAAVATPA